MVTTTEHCYIIKDDRILSGELNREAREILSYDDRPKRHPVE